MKTTLQTALALCLLIGVSSCKKEINPPNSNYLGSVEEGTLDLGNSVQANFFGQVVDEDGQPMENAIVELGSQSTTTNSNGVFRFDNADTREDLTHIKVSHANYYQSHASLVPQTNGHNYLRVEMIPKVQTTTFYSHDYHTHMVQPGIHIDFHGQYADLAGNEYSGQVTAFVEYIPSMDTETTERMPGNHFGEDANGSAVALETYGVLMIELYGHSGQVIQMAEGSHAVLRMRIDIDQYNNQASDELGIFYFDQNNGYWVENNKAQKDEDVYVAEIPYIGYWNLAQGFTPALVEGQVTNYYNDTLTHFPLALNSNNGQQRLFTNTNGFFKTYVPADQTITFMGSDECGEDVELSSGGPFAVGTNTQDVFVQAGTVDFMSVHGRLVDCSGYTVSDGYVLATYAGQTYPHMATNGTYKVDLIKCSDDPTVEVFAHSYTEAVYSYPYQKNISQPITDIGDIIICPAYEEYLTYSIDQGPEQNYYGDLYCVQNDTGGGLFYQIYPADMSVNIIGNVFEQGSVVWSAPQQPVRIGVKAMAMNPMSPFSINVNFIKYGDVGNYVAMTFDGVWTDYNMNTHTISGACSVLRDQ